MVFTKIALLTGWFLLGVGVAGILFVPSARVWGKRHLYLLGTVILILSSIWGGLCGGGLNGTHQRYNSLLWARIFQGVGTAPFEALVNASVGDLYFVHVREGQFVSRLCKANFIVGERQANGSHKSVCFWRRILYTNFSGKDHIYHWMGVSIPHTFGEYRMIRRSVNCT